MPGAIRAVDELNRDWRELVQEFNAGVVAPEEVLMTSQATDTEPAPPPSEPADEEVTKPELGNVAGIVRIPGEELFEAIESEEDIVAANRELLEGRPLTSAETERWSRLCNDVMRECNKRLEVKGVVLLAAVPEPNGVGMVMTGCDRASLDAASRGIAMPSEDYTVVVSLPARERVDIAATSREDFARGLIDSICSECIGQQKAYRGQ